MKIYASIDEDNRISFSFRHKFRREKENLGAAVVGGREEMTEKRKHKPKPNYAPMSTACLFRYSLSSIGCKAWQKAKLKSKYGSSVMW